ncbi:M24 family metallopeptidase [Candidatus Similichlamydia epinepheli]|uniref:M24 family metallopeptidase n=1 Tax=Candidatus Similichlamydia epinepheli TaxID=1903953 RepID=UPI00130063EB|nr:M24 family metallopeptidase [Candidatus Similichlamydia epinepheli]
MSAISPVESRILQAQMLLEESSLDGWLLCSYKSRNDVFVHFFSPELPLNVEFPLYFWIPRSGSALLLIDERDFSFVECPIEVRAYSSWRKRNEFFESLLGSSIRIASEFSFKSFVPQISFLDAGLYTLVRSFGIEVVSSEDIVSELLQTWTQTHLKKHLFAASVLQRICSSLPKKISDGLSDGSLTETSIQSYLISVLNKYGCVTNVPPRVLVNEHSSYPFARSLDSMYVHWGDYLLVDLSCRKQEEDSPYATLSRSFFLGDNPPSELSNLFFLGKKTQNVALDFMRERRRDRHSCLGWEVDRVARDFISLADFGESFRSSLGYSLGTQSCVGLGPALDDFYCHETRTIVNRSGFCIGPALHVQDAWGIDTKTSIYLSNEGDLFLTTGEQTEIYTFTKDREIYIPLESSPVVSF